eukprot:g53448.t1
MQAFFFATVLLIARAVPPSISSMVYTSLKEAKPCVRLLHKDGVIGCGTPYSGSTGTVRYTPSQADFNALVASPPSSYAVALVLPFDLFTEANLKIRSDQIRSYNLMSFCAITSAILIPFNDQHRADHKDISMQIRSVKMAGVLVVERHSQRGGCLGAQCLWHGIWRGIDRFTLAEKDDFGGSFFGDTFLGISDTQPSLIGEFCHNFR